MVWINLNCHRQALSSQISAMTRALMDAVGALGVDSDLNSRWLLYLVRGTEKTSEKHYCAQWSSSCWMGMSVYNSTHNSSRSWVTIDSGDRCGPCSAATTMKRNSLPIYAFYVHIITFYMLYLICFILNQWPSGNRRLTREIHQVDTTELWYIALHCITMQCSVLPPDFLHLCDVIFCMAFQI